MKTTLYVSGAVIKFVGIMLVSSTDVIPMAGSFAAGAAASFDRRRAQF